MVILSGTQRNRRIPQINRSVTLRDPSTSLGMTGLLPIPVLAAEELHDISPPVDYSLISPWQILLRGFVSLTGIGLVIWLIAKSFGRPTPPLSPRERALALLRQTRTQIPATAPSCVSIR